jgi:hypothetical protein
MSDRDYWDSSSTQRAHLKSARDSARADYYSNPKGFMSKEEMVKVIEEKIASILERYK